MGFSIPAFSLLGEGITAFGPAAASIGGAEAGGALARLTNKLMGKETPFDPFLAITDDAFSKATNPGSPTLVRPIPTADSLIPKTKDRTVQTPNGPLVIPGVPQPNYNFSQSTNTAQTTTTNQLQSNTSNISTGINQLLSSLFSQYGNDTTGLPAAVNFVNKTQSLATPAVSTSGAVNYGVLNSRALGTTYSNLTAEQANKIYTRQENDPDVMLMDKFGNVLTGYASTYNKDTIDSILSNGNTMGGKAFKYEDLNPLSKNQALAVNKALAGSKDPEKRRQLALAAVAANPTDTTDAVYNKIKAITDVANADPKLKQAADLKVRIGELENGPTNPTNPNPYANGTAKETSEGFKLGNNGTLAGTNLRLEFDANGNPIDPTKGGEAKAAYDRSYAARKLINDTNAQGLAFQYSGQPGSLTHEYKIHSELNKKATDVRLANSQASGTHEQDQYNYLAMQSLYKDYVANSDTRTAKQVKDDAYNEHQSTLDALNKKRTPETEAAAAKALANYQKVTFNTPDNSKNIKYKADKAAYDEYMKAENVAARNTELASLKEQFKLLTAKPPVVAPVAEAVPQLSTLDKINNALGTLQTTATNIALEHQQQVDAEKAQFDLIMQQQEAKAKRRTTGYQSIFDGITFA